ncbi:g10331 [Coccomyxa viridis]|uniref:Ribonuclease n=1 Tax=Coccomyxa viridis TaxID=1274662 RepID=A0ABP1G9E4_9CHLO
MGIDEAGRGPVLGPMVYGCAYCPLSMKHALTERSFADSKTLNEEKRDTLFLEIAEDASLGTAVDVLDACILSAQMLASQRESLNVLANNSTFRLIDEVRRRGVNLKEVYVDTVGEAGRHQDRLSERFPDIRFTVCPKADAIYPIVSAASIVAKVTRDKLLREHLYSETVDIGKETGSGYPGDPETKAWLQKHVDPVFGFPNLVRFSWSTCVRILETSAVPVQWECEDEAAEMKGQKSLPFGGKAGKAEASSGLGRHAFYRAHKLQRVGAF